MILEFADKLLANVEAFRTKEAKVFSSGLSKDELMQILKSRSETNAKLMAENNEIIEGSLRPLLVDVSSLTPAAVDSLYELAQEFLEPKTYDMGLSLEIHKALVVWAKGHDDPDRLIRSLFGAGRIYSMIHEHMQRMGNLKFRNPAINYLRQGTMFRRRYFEIENSETRLFICRCLSSMYVSFFSDIETEEEVENLFNFVEETIGFFTDEKVRAHDPDLPWDVMTHISYQNMSNVLYWLRQQPEGSRDKALAQLGYESYVFLAKMGNHDNFGDFWTRARREYTRIAAMYVSKRMSYQAALQQYRNTFYATDVNDYSINGLFSMTYLSVVLIQHLELSPDAKQDPETMEEIQKIVRMVVDYCKNVPEDMDRQMFYRFIAIASRYFSTVLDFDDYLDLILNFTTYTHLSTRVHSVMTQKLTLIIAEHFMDTAPEHFISICNSDDEDDVLKNREVILSLIGRAALCHDIGKALYISTTALATRRLYDYEFDIIKEHTNTAKLISSANGKNQLVIDVIRGHHKWYDGTKGYPEDFDNSASPYKFAIELVSIADSLDAATDNIGRSYAQTKTLQEVIGEFEHEAGTRYNPDIAKALKNCNELQQKLAHCLDEERKDVYYNTYKQMTK
ncbi:MAG: HD domain-containing protein [Defluviitaleaceae bacterium]|nr:HD domain-containing protein [Defluviitaleaceae bacterium]